MPKNKYKHSMFDNTKSFKYSLFPFEETEELVLIKDRDFSFDSFPPKDIIDIIVELNKYSGLNNFGVKEEKKIFNWQTLKDKFNCHEIYEKEVIEKNCKLFYDESKEKYSLWSIQINDSRRLLFYRIDDVCYPLGLDKYHFLFPENNEKGKINQIKHIIYHYVRHFKTNYEADEITNKLIIETNTIQEIKEKVEKIIKEVKKIKIDTNEELNKNEENFVKKIKSFFKKKNKKS